VYVIYSFLTLLALVAGAPWFAWQAVRHRKYVGSLGQRLGRLPASFNADRSPSIWIHAVSVGEVLATRALLQDLQRRYPHLKLFVSTTTLTGQQVAKSRLTEADGIFYFPFDLPWTVHRTLDLLQPVLFVMMETEIWPQLLRACQARQIRTVLVNGRISRRSYPRYLMARRFFAHVLAHVDTFCMQSAESARRIIEIGAAPARVQVTGSLKFDSLDAPAGPAGLREDGVLRHFRVSDGRVGPSRARC
jgi:3-deoxy-D-manno-octulosonic-acid transferase